MPEDHSLAWKQIQAALTDCQGDTDAFALTLRREHIAHISFSQVSAVEFCPRRYYLQYVLGCEPEPLPDYFRKGKLLHQLIAHSYLQQIDGQAAHPDEVDQMETAQAREMIASHFEGEAQRQLLNAFHLHQQHRWQEVQVLAVEHAFVMRAGDGLPPMVGVIDLVLQREGAVVLVDHKTGRGFYPDDELQVAIYAKYVQQTYGGPPSRLFYDHYRWVTHLERVRKPAFQRNEARNEETQWPLFLERIQRAYSVMRRIHSGGEAACSGECFRCPYRGMCR